MTVHSPATGNGVARKLEADLREAILDELRHRGLDDPEMLAFELDVLPLAAAELLRNSQWTVETGLWLVHRLDLPIRVGVTHQ